MCETGRSMGPWTSPANWSAACHADGASMTAWLPFRVVSDRKLTAYVRFGSAMVVLRSVLSAVSYWPTAMVSRWYTGVKGQYRLPTAMYVYASACDGVEARVYRDVQEGISSLPPSPCPFRTRSSCLSHPCQCVTPYHHPVDRLYPPGVCGGVTLVG
jgi:hypothetical protein